MRCSCRPLHSTGIRCSPAGPRDGNWLYFRLEDDRSIQLARLRLRDGRVERLTEPGHTVSDFDIGREGHVALVMSSSDKPAEIFALDKRRLAAADRAKRRLAARGPAREGPGPVVPQPGRARDPRLVARAADWQRPAPRSRPGSTCTAVRSCSISMSSISRRSYSRPMAMPSSCPILAAARAAASSSSAGCSRSGATRTSPTCLPP